MASNLPPFVDPRHVRIKRKEAAKILGVSPATFDRMRNTDPHCPKGYASGEAKTAPVYFRLSDIYAYSDRLMAASEPV